MADVKLTMEADVAQAIRANEQLAASEDKVAQSVSRKAAAVEAANRRVERSAQHTAEKVQEYELAAVGSADNSGIRISSATSRVSRPRALSLAPLASTQLYSSVPIPATAGTYDMAHEVRRRTLEARADLQWKAGDAADEARNRRLRENDENKARLQQIRDMNKIEAYAEEQKDKQQRLDNMKTAVLAGAAAFATALVAVGDRIIAAMEQARSKLDDFYKSGRGAMSLPAYVKNSTAFKQMSVGLSNEFGADVNQVVNPLLEQISVQGPDLSDKQRVEMARSSLQFNQMTGGSAAGYAGLIDNIRDVMPGMGIRAAGNLVTYLRNSGGLSVENQEQVLGKLIPQMSRLNIPVEQVAAVAAMTSQMGGPESVMAKGAVAAMGKLEQLKKKRLISGKGDLLDSFAELDALAQRRPDLISENFSELGNNAAPVIHYLGTHGDDFRRAAGDAKAAMAGDSLDEQFSRKYRSDPEFRLAIDSERLKQQQGNAVLQTSIDEQRRQVDLERKKAGVNTLLTIGEGDSLGQTVGKKIITGLGGEYWLPRVPGAAQLNSELYNDMYTAPESARNAIPGMGSPSPNVLQPAPASSADKLDKAADKLNAVLDQTLTKLNGSPIRPAPTTNVGITNYIGAQ